MALMAVGGGVASASTVPLEASFDYTASLTSPTAGCAGAVYTLATEGTGQGTILGGNVKLHAPERCVFAIPGSTNTFNTRGPVVYEARDGDMLFGESNLSTVLSTTTAVNDGTITITGGTGRFAGASGVGHWHCQADLGTGIGHGHLSADLVRP